MRALALAVLAGFLALAAGEAAGAPPKPATVKVAIEQMRFSTPDLAVKSGDTIVWTNTDVVAHTVTAQDGAFDSNLIPPGGTWKYTARKKGTFAYRCSYHPTMTARLTVR